MRISEKFQENTLNVIKVQEQMQRIADIANINKIQVETPIVEALKPITENNIMQAIGEKSIAMHRFISTYQFESPALKSFEVWSSKAAESFATRLTALIQSPMMHEMQSINTNLSKWLNSIYYSPLTKIIENISNIGFYYNYEEVKEVFQKAMFDSKWFPYASWIEDSRIVNEVFNILDTSRASKNRTKKIDKVILSYYDAKEINYIKRGWGKKNLPNYVIRILRQSVQAYHRREYALTVSALSTLWEGIIQEKMNDISYRTSRKTRQNLTKLIEENGIEKIVSSFCEDYIFYVCKKPEDVKQDVPGRHCIAHCWFESYPNRKMALNAILFTDFLLGLKPLEKMED